MQEWDPEHFTSFEHLCEVTLAAVREKTEAEQIYLWLRAPESQLYSFQLEQGLICLNAEALAPAKLPIIFIEHALDKGQLVVEQTAPTADVWETVEPETPRLRACFPLKRHKGLEAVVYLETRRRLDRLSRQYPVADALPGRRAGEPIARQPDRSGAGSTQTHPGRPHPQSGVAGLLPQHVAGAPSGGGQAFPLR